MKTISNIILALCLLFTAQSCTRSLTAYEGDLFLPQQFTTSCMEESNTSHPELGNTRDFTLKSNGDLIRKNPDGTSFYFKNQSSISMMADPDEGLAILWLAKDLSSGQDLTVYLYESSILLVYENGENCHYRASCIADMSMNEIDFRDALTLLTN